MRTAHRILRSAFVAALAALAVASCASSKPDDGVGGGDAGVRKDRGALKDTFVEEDWLWPDTGRPDTSETDQAAPREDQGTPPADQSTPPADQGTPPADQSTPTPDKSTPPADLGVVDATPAGPVTCGNTGVWIQEVATGSPDFVALKNAGATAISVVGYKIEMYGISATAPEVYTIKATDVSGDLSPNAVLYVFEYSAGKDPGDINTGANIPFYDGDTASSQKPNVVLLYDAAGQLVDYFAVGATVALPSNVTFGAVAWPATFDSDLSSFQRSAYTGSCPAFKTGDWGTASITRR